MNENDRQIKGLVGFTTEDISEIVAPETTAVDNSVDTEDNKESTGIDTTEAEMASSEIKKLRQEITQLSKQLDEEKDEKLKYRIENISLRSQVQDLSDKLDELMKQVDSQKNDNAQETEVEDTIKTLVNQSLDCKAEHQSKILYEQMLNQFVIIKETMISECIMTPEDIADLDAEEICILLKGSKFEDELRELKNFKMELAKARPQMNSDQRKDILKELTGELNDLAESSKATISELKRVARERNINYGKLDRTSSKMNGVTKPMFDGNQCNTNLYQFLKLVKSYCEFHNILHEDSGCLIKECLTGEAKSMLDYNFNTDTNPDPDEIVRMLKEVYGDRQVILNQIKGEHTRIGSVSSSNEPYEEIFSKISKHLLLIQNAVMITEEVQQGEPISLKSYLYKLLTFLPSGYICHYMDLSRHLAKQGDKLNVMERVYSELKTMIFGHLQNERAEDSSYFYFNDEY